MYLPEVGEARAHRHGRRWTVASNLAYFSRRASAPRAMLVLLATRSLPKEATAKRLILPTQHNARLCQMREPAQVRANLSHAHRLAETAPSPKANSLDRAGQMVQEPAGQVFLVTAKTSRVRLLCDRVNRRHHVIRTARSEVRRSRRAHQRVLGAAAVRRTWETQADSLQFRWRCARWNQARRPPLSLRRCTSQPRDISSVTCFRADTIKPGLPLRCNSAKKPPVKQVLSRCQTAASSPAREQQSCSCSKMTAAKWRPGVYGHEMRRSRSERRSPGLECRRAGQHHLVVNYLCWNV